MTVWNEFFDQHLADKQAQDNERQLTPMARDGLYAEVNGQRLLNLAGNDYLALGTCNDWQREFRQQLTAQGQYWSSSSSQLLTGHSPLHQQLEATLARLFQREAALTFASGYQMNFGLLNALSTGKVLILADKLVHASMVDGLLISKATFLRYRHNDMVHLHALLCQHHAAFERIIIVTESVFSMDGDIADLQQLVAFKREFTNVALYVDEAHAIGVRGESGLGCAEEQGCVAEIDFLVGTFGKAVHSVGGYVVCSRLARAYLINHMRPLIFSTALPPINMAWTDFVLQRLHSLQTERRHLQQLSRSLIAKVNTLHGHCVSQSHIVPVLCGSNAAALAQAQALREHGMLVMAVRPPTVPKNQARLRISLNAGLSHEQLETLMACL